MIALPIVQGWHCFPPICRVFNSYRWWKKCSVPWEKIKKASLLSICFFNCCAFLWTVPVVTWHGLTTLKMRRVMHHSLAVKRNTWHRLMPSKDSLEHSLFWDSGLSVFCCKRFFCGVWTLRNLQSLNWVLILWYWIIMMRWNEKVLKPLIKQLMDIIPYKWIGEDSLLMPFSRLAQTTRIMRQSLRWCCSLSLFKSENIIVSTYRSLFAWIPGFTIKSCLKSVKRCISAIYAAENFTKMLKNWRRRAQLGLTLTHLIKRRYGSIPSLCANKKNGSWPVGRFTVVWFSMTGNLSHQDWVLIVS